MKTYISNTDEINASQRQRQDSLKNLESLRPLFITYLLYIAFFLFLVPGLFLLSISLEKKEIFFSIIIILSFVFVVYFIAFYFLKSFSIKNKGEQ